MSGNNYKYAGNNDSLSELSKDLLRLLDNKGLFSDAVLQCDGVEIPVHKCILSARSTVFAAMFQSQMQEGLSGVVKITDIKLNVLQVALRYLYSGQTNCIPDEFVEDLLDVADKYGLEDLKQVCIDKLKSILSLKNMFDILILGDLHDVTLKAHAINFIGQVKFSMFEETEEWKSLEEKYPKLAMEVMRSIVKNVQDSPQKVVAEQDSTQKREADEYTIYIQYVSRNKLFSNGRTIHVNVKATDTLQNVKEKIHNQDKEGIPTAEQRLFLEWTENQGIRKKCHFQLLQDNKTLTDYHIGEHSSLSLTRAMELFVKYSESIIYLVVERNYTIEIVKKIIEYKELIPVDQQRLILAGAALEDRMSLGFYNITSESDIRLMWVEKSSNNKLERHP